MNISLYPSVHHVCSAVRGQKRPGVVDSSEQQCWKHNWSPLPEASAPNRAAHLQPKLFLEKMCRPHTVVDAFLSSQARENLDLNRAIPKDARS